jgi:predicted Zn-dependent peptidase
MSIKNHHKDVINIHTFPNGFRVIYQKPKQSLPITSVHVFCGVGSILETEKVRGVCHFVEHMCFKGTKQNIDPNGIFVSYDKIGAYLNAYTEKEYTCYTLKCADVFVENSTHILADMILNSTFPKKEFIKEQKVIVEENIRDMNDYEWFFFDKLNAIFYNGSSFAYPIDSIEYHPNATTLKYTNVVEWYKWFYHPDNMVLSITSNLSFSEIIRIIKTSFFVKMKPRNMNSIPMHIKSLALELPILELLPIYSKPNKIRIELFKKKEMATNYVGVGFRTCNKKNMDKYSLELLNHILNGLSGRLFTLLREKNGLTYRSESLVEFKDHTGYFLIYAETDPQKTILNDHKMGVLPIIIQLIKDLKENGITNEELDTFKGNMKGKYLMDLEDMDNLTSYNGIEFLSSPNDNSFKRQFVDYNDIYEKYIAKITKKEIQDVIDKYFIVDNMIVYILGEKIPSLKQVENICDVFY